MGDPHSADRDAGGGAGMRERGLAREVFGLYGTNAVRVTLGALSGIITARMLGPHDRGVLALVYLLPATVSTLVKLGLAQAGVYSIRREAVAPERVVANAVIVSFTLGGMSALVTVLLRGPLLSTALRGVPQWAVLMTLPLIPLLLFESYFFAVLQALGRFRLQNSRRFIGGVFLLLGMFTGLVVFRGGLREAILVAVIAPAVMDAWLLLGARRWLPFRLRLDWPLLRRELRFGLKSHVQVLAQHLHLRADVYLVAYFLDPAQVAFYVLATRLAELLLDVPESVGIVLYPRLASLDEPAMNALSAQACRRTVVVTGIGAALLALFGPLLIVLWYGPAYAPAGAPLRVIMLGAVMMSVSLLLTRSFTSRNKQEVNIAAGFLALAANVTLNMFLIPRLGIVGAAAASAISYSMAATLLVARFRRESRGSMSGLLLPTRDDWQFFWSLCVRAIDSGRKVLQRLPAS
jgi:O-antigen/teichoic acid export membrane protein